MNEDRYNVSKLLEIFIVRQLADQMGPSSPVTVNCLNPGFCRTEFFRNGTAVLKAVVTVTLQLVGRTAEMGSRTLLAAATAGEDSHGQYMDSCRVWAPSQFVTSEEGGRVQKRIYKELMEVLEGIEPGVTKNV